MSGVLLLPCSQLILMPFSMGVGLRELPRPNGQALTILLDLITAVDRHQGVCRVLVLVHNPWFYLEEVLSKVTQCVV